MTSDRHLALMALMREIDEPTRTFNRSVRLAGALSSTTPQWADAVERGNAALDLIETAVRAWVASHPASHAAAPAADRCGARHHRYPDTVCTELAGHYRRDRDSHAAPLVIGGQQRGAAAWDEPETGSRPCGHDDYHDPHEWADQPGIQCPGHRAAVPAVTPTT